MDDVRDAVSRIRADLPIDATEPYIGRATTAGAAIIAFGVSAENMSDTELSWFVDLNVMRDISSVPGVGQVNRIGGASREVRVDLDPDRMASLGVTAGEVSSQLVRTQVELPGGETRIGSQEQSVRTLGTITNVQDGCASHTAAGWRSVRLNSIAEVRDRARREAGGPARRQARDRLRCSAWGEARCRWPTAREAVKELQQKYPNIQLTELYTQAERSRQLPQLDVMLAGRCNHRGVVPARHPPR
jgi:Cu/Ag efflux pump CusA